MSSCASGSGWYGVHGGRSDGASERLSTTKPRWTAETNRTRTIVHEFESGGLVEWIRLKWGIDNIGVKLCWRGWVVWLDGAIEWPRTTMPFRGETNQTTVNALESVGRTSGRVLR